MDENSHDNYILSLSEKDRKNLIVRSYNIIYKVAKQQLSIVKNIDQRTIKNYDWRHKYFFVIVRGFWKDAKYIISLERSKYKSYSVYVARAMMEKALKLIWFSHQDEKGQNSIAIKEMLKQCLELYRLEKEKEGKDFYIDKYQYFNSSGEFPDIDKANMKDLKSFPSYEELCLKSRLKDAKNLYNSYRYLSARPHADFLWTFIDIEVNDGSNEEYRRSLMLATRFLIEVTKVIDFHIDRKTKKEIEAALKIMDDLRLGKVE